MRRTGSTRVESTAEVELCCYFNRELAGHRRDDRDEFLYAVQQEIDFWSRQH